jgi:DNA topoisomerase-1
MERKEEIKESLQEEHGEQCPKCGRDLVVKWGRNGRFIACTGYPECRYTQPLEPVDEVEEICDQCGAKMVVKQGRYGRFLACTNYPDCRNTKSISTGIQCPIAGCGGQIVEKKSRKGRAFYGCSRYPACKFASWYKPVAKSCPVCGHAYLELRTSKAKGRVHYCPACRKPVEKAG